MEAATHAPFTVVHADAEATPPTRVRLEGDRLIIDRLIIRDQALATFVGEQFVRDALFNVVGLVRTWWNARSGSACSPCRMPG